MDDAKKNSISYHNALENTIDDITTNYFID